MDRIDALRVFVQVVECASFTRAADALHLPRSSVSTAVQDLEARVGARLLQRTTRRVAPTQDGAEFYDRCIRLIADYEETELLFRQSAPPSGKLKISAPGRIGRLVIAPALPEFLDAYPDIEIEICVTDRMIDLVQENVDCVIRVGFLENSSLVARRIGDLTLCNCASPGYLERYGVPATPADLDRHFAVNYASPLSGRIDKWEIATGGKPLLRSMRSRVSVDNAEAYIACALAGLGLIQVPLYDVRAHLAAKELIEVMSGWRAAPLPVTLLTPHRRHSARRLRVFIAWIAALLRSRLNIEPGNFEAEAPAL